MRQIKFRAWHTKQQTLADVSAIDFNDFGGTGTITTEYGDEWGLEWCVLEQFTGLKDKNGKEIYEGEIYLRTDTKDTYVVIWETDGFVARKIYDAWLDKNVYEEKKDIYISLLSTFNIKSIGNIHEDK